MARLRCFSGAGIDELSLFCRHGHIEKWSACVPSLALEFMTCRCSVDTDTSANVPSAFLFLALEFMTCRCSVDMGTSANGPSAFLFLALEFMTCHCFLDTGTSANGRWNSRVVVVLSTQAHKLMVRLRSLSDFGINDLLFCRPGNTG